MAFLETPRFPTNIDFESPMGPMFSTTIVRTFSGHEKANKNWKEDLFQCDVGYGVRTLDQFYLIYEFMLALTGMAERFRFKVPWDFKSSRGTAAITPTDQLLGTGDGVKTQFQLVKKTTVGSLSYTKTVKKPVAGTVRPALNDIEQTSGFTVDTTTGIVTFTTPPGAGVTVKAGLEWDRPVRFDTDLSKITMRAWKVGGLSIPIVEVRV